MNIKSGNTPLIKSKELSKQFGIDILIKDESKNPFGTWKDRRSEEIFNKAEDEKIDKLVLITSGNSGYSLGRFFENSNIKIVCIIDKDLKKSTKDKLNKFTGVVEVDLSKEILKSEQVIALARESDKEFILDVTNGFHEAYETLTKELEREKPDYIFLPFGSGEAFVGLYNGIKKSKLNIKLIGVGTKTKNSFADKLYSIWTPYKSKINSILKEGHKIIYLDEEEIKSLYKDYKDKFSIEPSSSVVFGALHKINLDKNKKVILINSGKGLF